MVQWLRFRLPMQGVWVQSLVRKLRSHISLGQKTKTWNRSSIVTNSRKTLKMVHIKKKKKRGGKESRVRCYFKELRMWGLLCSRTKTQREFSSAFQTPTSSWYDVPKEVRVWSPIRLIIKWTLLPFCMHMFSVTQSCLTLQSHGL